MRRSYLYIQSTKYYTTYECTDMNAAPCTLLLSQPIKAQESLNRFSALGFIPLQEAFLCSFCFQGI